MSSQTIEQLREPPNVELAHDSALDALNRSFADSVHLDGLQGVLNDARTTQLQLQQQVRLKSTSLSICRSSLHSLLNQKKRLVP